MMIKSMTGYGKGESKASVGNFVVEIRSVNHRYCEISVRLPRTLYSLENELKKMVGTVLKRGKIDISVQLEEKSSDNLTPLLDMSMAQCYYNIYSRLAKELNLPQDADPAFIMSQKGVIKEVVVDVGEIDLKPNLIEALAAALSAIDQMRTHEGMTLAMDLAARRLQISELVDEIDRLLPKAVLEYHQKLKIRLEQMLEGSSIDESRLLQEVAILVDRSDITEELVRLGSHFKQFDEASQSVEPVGRKLDFIIQEMNREINTIGSKSNNSEITALVIHIKAEIEKMREQIQNVE